jgi:outer membrane immunogenic protein
MKKGNFLVVGLATVAILFGTQAAVAAPGDGLSIGGFGGYGTATVGGKFTDLDTSVGGTDKEYEMKDGGLGAEGAEYGVVVGYGLRMGPVLAGIEGEAAWSDIKIKAKIAAGFSPNQGSAGDGSSEDITSASAEMERSYAATARLGYYLSPTSVFYIKGGGVASLFDVKYGADSKEYWAPGVRLGAGIESDLGGGLSIRVEGMHNNYYNANVQRIGRIAQGGSADNNSGVKVELYPSSFVARVGVNLNFSSLF